MDRIFAEMCAFLHRDHLEVVHTHLQAIKLLLSQGDENKISISMWYDFYWNCVQYNKGELVQDLYKSGIINLSTTIEPHSNNNLFHPVCYYRREQICFNLLSYINDYEKNLQYLYSANKKGFTPLDLLLQQRSEVTMYLAMKKEPSQPSSQSILSQTMYDNIMNYLAQQKSFKLKQEAAALAAATTTTNTTTTSMKRKSSLSFFSSLFSSKSTNTTNPFEEDAIYSPTVSDTVSSTTSSVSSPNIPPTIPTVQKKYDWQVLQGSLKQIAAGFNQIFGVNSSGELFRYNFEKKYLCKLNLEFAIKQVSTSRIDGKTLLLNENGNVYKWKRLHTQNEKEAILKPMNTMPQQWKQICCVQSKLYYGIDLQDIVHMYESTTKLWIKLDGVTFKYISANASGVVVGVNTKNSICVRQSKRSDKGVVVSNWIALPGTNFKMVEISEVQPCQETETGNELIKPCFELLAISMNDELMKWNEKSKNWKKMDGLLSFVTFDSSNNLYGCSPFQQILLKRKQGYWTTSE